MTVLLSVTLLAVVALMTYGLAYAWRRVMRETAPLPLYAMLRHRGLTVREAGDGLGVEALAHAARRCALCGQGAECQRRVAAGEPAPADCPNAELFAGLTRPRA